MWLERWCLFQPIFKSPLRLFFDYSFDRLPHRLSASHQFLRAEIKANTLYSLHCIPLQLEYVMQKTFNVSG